MVRLFGIMRIAFAATILLGIQTSVSQEESETGEDITGRQEYFQLRRAGGPGRSVARDAFEQAVRQYLATPRDRDNLTSSTSLINWVSVNPTGMFYNRTGANYISGRTNSIAFHPSDANIMYIASAGGGVWKTTDGGANWQVLTDGLTSLTSGAVAVDQANPNVVYYATGELNYSGDSYYGDGIYKSTSAGTTWTKVATTTVGSYLSQLAIDPTNSNIVYVSGNNGVYKSTNAGASWSSTGSSTGTNCVLVDPTNTQILYTSTGSYWNVGTIEKSTNGGTSWSTVTSGITSSPQLGRIQLAMAPSNSAILYASIAIHQNGALKGLYKSTDGGASWTLQNSATNYLGSQGWYDNVVCVNPTDPTLVLVGGIDIYSSVNSGSTLTQRTSWSTTSASNMSHADIHFLGYRGTVLYCGSDGGVYKSTNDGVNWSDLNATLSTLQMQSADYDPSNILNMFGGTQDNDKQTTTNGGTQWIQRTTGDGGYTVVDPVNTNYVYGAYVNGSLLRSSDSGVSFTSIQPSGSTGGLFYNPYEMAPGDHNTIVYCEGDVWKTTSAQTATTASGWSQLATTGTVGGAVSAIGISSTNTNKIYIGTSNGRILATTNNGSSWTTTTGYPYVSDFAVDAVNDDIAYATFTGTGASVHVYKTTNGGTSWFTITGSLPNIPCNSIVLRNTAPRTLFVGTDLGVYKSTDEGTSWSSFNNGLPPATVYDLKYKEGNQLLLAATHGRGVWKFDYASFLPVQLASLNAFATTNGRVRVVWTTMSEINNYGFEVQKSLGNDQSYQTIPNSFIPGHGTTIQPHSYAFEDVNATSGNWFYRLKQIDLDGSVHYSGGVQVNGVTSIVESALPSAFALDQNYPNPFNPSTRIRYALPFATDVQLTVYNSLGEIVATLLDGKMQEGYHEIEFSNSSLPSGVYFYKLRAGSFVESRKMMLVK